MSNQEQKESSGLNSLIQTLNTVPEFTTAIKNFSGSPNPDTISVFCEKYRDFLNQFGNPNGLVNTTAAELYQAFQNAFPGLDVDLDPMAALLAILLGLIEFDLCMIEQPDRKPRSIAWLLFATYKVVIYMSPSEKCAFLPNQGNEQAFLHLPCIVKDGSNLVQGLKDGKAADQSKVEYRYIPGLGRTLDCTSLQGIIRLPAYLIIRMHWPANAENPVRKFQIPFNLDMFELCESSLQEEFGKMRQILEIVKNSEPEAGEEKIQLPTSFPDDVGSNNSGFYELKAALSKEGVAGSESLLVTEWDKEMDSPWFKIDGEEVTRISLEKLLNLGGAESEQRSLTHYPHMLIYGPKIVFGPKTIPRVETVQIPVRVNNVRPSGHGRNSKISGKGKKLCGIQ